MAAQERGGLSERGQRSVGPNLSASAVPALNRVIEQAALVVRDPVSKLTLAATARDRKTRERARCPAAGATT
jgi:hypothetical protein